MDDNKQQHLRGWARALYQALETNDGSRSFAECLEMAADAQSGSFRSVLDAVREIVCLGYSLSGAMSLTPSVFPPDLLTVVRYGELYGELDVTLRRYAEHPEDTYPRCRLTATS